MNVLRTTRSQFLAVLGVAVLVRVLGVLTLPLIISNDGANYLEWGQTLAGGAWPDFPATRTPGYPLALAGVFKVLGQSAFSILVAQALLGVGSSLLAWYSARSIAGNRAGLIAGLAIAIEPWLFVFEHYALSETLTLFLVLLAIACSLTARKNRVIAPSFGAGLAIAAAVLTRPAMQAWIPFVLAACVFGAASRMQWYRPAIACVLGATALLGPWLVYNINRGIPRIVETDGLALWGGLARSQLLMQEYEIPEQSLQESEVLFRESPPSEPELLGYYSSLQHVDGLDRSVFLSAWAKKSIADNPVGYAKAVIHAALWQSNAMAPGSPYTHDELLWQMRRLGRRDSDQNQPAPNIQISRTHTIDERFYDSVGVGPQAWLYRNWPIGMPHNIIHPALGALSLCALCLLIRRKQYAPAVLILGAFALVLAHALLLQPFPRYSMTAWAVWWIAASTLLSYKQGSDEHQRATT